jgi:hypothetical protein
LAGRALIAAARTGVAVGRGAVAAYRTSRQAQRNRNIERIMRMTSGSSAMRGLGRPINYSNNATRRRYGY